MISERSCDTEDWSKDSQAKLLKKLYYILKYVQIENYNKML